MSLSLKRTTRAQLASVLVPVKVRRASGGSEAAPFNQIVQMLDCKTDEPEPKVERIGGHIEYRRAIYGVPLNY